MKETTMYQRTADGAMQELLYESLGEFDAPDDKKWYSWVVYHKQGFNDWARKPDLKAEYLTRWQAGWRNTEHLTNLTKQLWSGWLHLTRYYWDGKDWQKEHCDIIDLANLKQIYKCP